MSLFNINAGIGLIVALVILAVTVVYNVAALIVNPVPAGVGVAIPNSPERPPPEEPPPPEQPPP